MALDVRRVVAALVDPKTRPPAHGVASQPPYAHGFAGGSDYELCAASTGAMQQHEGWRARPKASLAWYLRQNRRPWCAATVREILRHREKRAQHPTNERPWHCVADDSMDSSARVFR